MSGPSGRPQPAAGLYPGSNQYVRFETLSCRRPGSRLVSVLRLLGRALEASLLLSGVPPAATHASRGPSFKQKPERTAHSFAYWPMNFF